MNTNLILQTVQLLQHEISPETGIDLKSEQLDVLPAASLLLDYNLSPIRQKHLLAIYIAITFASNRHYGSSYTTQEELIRKILDGDYLYSLYIELCLRYEEHDFFTHLAPLVKQMQIDRFNDVYNGSLLLDGLETFLKLNCSDDKISKAI